MLESARIAVVIPARNEERWIADTIATLPGFVDEAVVVNDGSDDGTAAQVCVARSRVGASLRVVPVHHATPRGVGGAIVSGYRRAWDLGADVVAVMAGDGQMHPDDLRSVVLPVARGHAHYVKGDRLGHPSIWRTMPTHRLVFGHALSQLTRVAVGLASLRDSQCGYTAISRGALERLDLDAIWAGYGYPNDLLGAVARAGLEIAEVPVRPVYRGEASGLRPWHLATIGWLIARVGVRRLSPFGRTLASPLDGPAPSTAQRTLVSPRAQPLRASPPGRPPALA